MDDIAKQLELDAHGIANTTFHFLTLAKKYYDEGNVEFAKACLLLLCKKCDNYEESIEFNKLTETWQKLRHIVEGFVPPSIRIHAVTPKAPAECTKQINDILLLPDDHILAALSVHLGELSGNGNSLNYLNKWERTIYLADELCAEVNSGGFDSYLYYRGLHFEKAYNALECIFAFDVLQILNSVRGKFPTKRIPKSIEGIQNAMDSLEAQGIDFEAEDIFFYSSGEKQLLKCLFAYVKENKNHLR